MKQWIVFPDAYQPLTPQSVGGKAAQLYRLQAAGIATAEWFVIPAHCLTTLLPNANELNVADIGAITLTEPFTDAVEDALNKLGGNSFAVRSSATTEDATNASFAGQFASFLFVNKQDVVSAVKKVWASWAQVHIAHYAKATHTERGSIAVIVQRMLCADCAGVSFGIDPVSGNRSAVQISSCWGAGEGLVSGTCDADVFTLATTASPYRLLNQTIATKNLQASKASGGGISYTDVAPHLQKVASLSPEQLQAIAHTTVKLQQVFQRPQDVEWVIEKNKLYIVQSRPITTLATTADTT